jgi:hypothetical protein
MNYSLKYAFLSFIILFSSDGFPAIYLAPPSISEGIRTIKDNKIPYLDAFADKIASSNHNDRAEAAAFFVRILGPLLAPNDIFPARDYLIAQLTQKLDELRSGTKSSLYGQDSTYHITYILNTLEHKTGTRPADHSNYIYSLAEEAYKGIYPENFTDAIEAIIETRSYFLLEPLITTLNTKLRENNSPEEGTRIRLALMIIGAATQKPSREIDEPMNDGVASSF